MTESFLSATARGSRLEASAACGLKIPDAWIAERRFAETRLAQVRDDPAYAPWAPRALALRGHRAMIGHIGFHTAPGPDYLAAYAPGAVEFGYTIYEGYRGHGYATEACHYLMNWAREAHGVGRFVVSISPDNGASLRIAEKLGFVRVAEHEDPEDGLEYVFVTPATYSSSVSSTKSIAGPDAASLARAPEPPLP